MCRSVHEANEDEVSSSYPHKRVWALTTDSIMVIRYTNDGRMAGVSAKLSGALAFPASGLTELGNTMLTYGSAPRMVLWDAQVPPLTLPMEYVNLPSKTRT